MIASWLIGSSASAGLVGVDRSLPPIRDWAFEQLTGNRAQFAEASQLYVEGKLEECHAVLSKLRVANPVLPQPDLVIVWLHLSNHKLSEAKARLESLAAAAPRDAQVALTLGQIALAESRLADAAAHLERTALLPLPQAWPTQQRESFARTTLDTLAIAYERQLRWADAKNMLATLIAMGDQELHYSNRLARAHYNLGELDQAQVLLAKVSERSAGALPVPLLVADLAFSSGKIHEASEAINQAVQQHPDNPEVQLWLAEWHLMDNQLDAADRALAAAKQAGQNSARYWITLGQCRMLQTRYGDAAGAFRDAIKLLESLKEPQRAAVATHLLALALVCHEPSDVAGREEAVTVAEQNALAYSTDPTYVGGLAWIYFKVGRKEAAQLLIRRALELNARVSSDLSFYAADIYAADQPEAARTFLKAALESSRGIFVMRPLAGKLGDSLFNAP